MANQQASPTDSKRNAQMTIANSPTGVQKELFANPYKFDVMKFPDNVGDSSRNYHWIKFTPCIQEKSSYQVATEGSSTADLNRASGTSGLPGSTNPFGLGSSTATVGLLTAINGIGSIVENSGKVVQAALGNRNAQGEIAGEIAGKGVGGLVSGAIVSAINLSRKTKRAAASINLYMPDTITNQLVNDYDQVSLTQALGLAGLAAQGASAAGSSIAATISGLSGNNPTFGLGGGGTGTGTGFAAEAGGMAADKTGNFGSGITDVLLFSAGLAQNPQIELLFKSIQNRQFLFDFKLAPRNKKEAMAIIKIIQAFRFHAAPEIPDGSSGRYFIPPSEFDIEFMLGNSRNPNLPKISTCVLEGIDVNYASIGQWSAFEDGMPVEVSLQLRFKETEILHKKLIDAGY